MAFKIFLRKLVILYTYFYNRMHGALITITGEIHCPIEKFRNMAQYTNNCILTIMIPVHHGDSDKEKL